MLQKQSLRNPNDWFEVGVFRQSYRAYSSKAKYCRMIIEKILELRVQNSKMILRLYCSRQASLKRRRGISGLAQRCRLSVAPLKAVPWLAVFTWEPLSVTGLVVSYPHLQEQKHFAKSERPVTQPLVCCLSALLTRTRKKTYWVSYQIWNCHEKFRDQFATLHFQHST